MLRVLTSSLRYENPWMRVREDVFLRPDGTQGTYGVVERRGHQVVERLGDAGHVRHHPDHPRLGQRPRAERIASRRVVCSHVKSLSARPKCP